MAKGVKKIAWAGEGGVLPQYSLPDRIICIQPNQFAYFKVSEWYSDTTPEDKLRYVHWTCLSQEKLTVFHTVTKHPDEPFGIQFPRKLCGSYAYYIEASLYGKHDVRNTGLHIYGKCEEKITKATWSKQQNATNQSEINYGHHLYITIETEGLNGDPLTIELYSKKDETKIIKSQEAKCINGELVFKLDTMPCYMAAGGFPQEVEEFYIKVRDVTKKYFADASNSEEILSFTITNKFVFPEFEAPTNKTLLKAGTPDKIKEEDKMESDKEKEKCNCEEKFKKVAPIVLQHEGGYVNDPDDSGGETNKGITIGTFKAYAKEDLGIEPTSENLKKITDDQATIIYRKRYWEPKGFCKIKDDKVSLMIYDWTITSGGAAKQVQKLLVNEFSQVITIDGGIGSKTIDAINAVGDQDKLLNRLGEIRKQYYTNLAIKDGVHTKDYKFLTGWHNRVDDCINIKI